MRPRAQSLHQFIWPDTDPAFAAIAETFTDGMIVKMLGLVWEGFDVMKALHFTGIDFSQPIEQLERGLTDLHVREITLLWRKNRDGYEAFLPKHEPWEFQNRKSASAMPPSIDIGFELVANGRIRFNVEAKVLEHPKDVNRYLSDLNDKYLTGRGSPLSAEAALIGYLREGAPSDVFPHLDQRLGQQLSLCSAFADQAHRISQHERQVGNTNEKSPFTCHHLIPSLSS